ncbi:serine/arginine repetitive matrix protein 3-like [Psammomys obesus]|uniref:serine/arginine repetitive matrix protein 3-like n=1 Tax=Psammomys obesus TaxID=48139 RepID=UPI0024535E8A|nr:serine/arginine repetitive matrix protein 3-like [Psammomys obesus]
MGGGAGEVRGELAVLLLSRICENICWLGRKTQVRLTQPARAHPALGTRSCLVPGPPGTVTREGGAGWDAGAEYQDQSGRGASGAKVLGSPFSGRSAAWRVVHRRAEPAAFSGAHRAVGIVLSGVCAGAAPPLPRAPRRECGCRGRLGSGRRQQAEPGRTRRWPGRRPGLRSAPEAAAALRGPARNEVQAASRRAPRSAAPRLPAAARASRAPAPTLEPRAGSARRGRGPQSARDPARVPIVGIRLLDAARGCGDPGTLQPAGRAPHRSALPSLARGFGLYGARSPRHSSTLPSAPPPPIHCIRFPFPAQFPSPQPSRTNPAILLGFSVHSWKFRAWTVSRSPARAARRAEEDVCAQADDAGLQSLPDCLHLLVLPLHVLSLLHLCGSRHRQHIPLYGTS